MLLTINELGIADAMDLRIAINAQDLAAKVNVTSPELLFRLMRSAATASRPGPLQRACRLVIAGCTLCAQGWQSSAGRAVLHLHTFFALHCAVTMLTATEHG